MKLLKAIGLTAGTIGAYVVAGLSAFLLVWTGLLGLFLVSRFSKDFAFFTAWSWPQFLSTIGLAFGLPYIALLLSPGF